MPGPALLDSRPLSVALVPSAIFAALAREHAGLFWLDAGASAVEGWSILGIGEPEADPDAPGRVRIDLAPPVLPGAPPFRGGWVGWRDYESGAQDAGAPAASSEDGPAWLRAQRALAFDHATGTPWALAPSAEMDQWIAELGALALTPAPPAEPASEEPAAGRAGGLRAEARHGPEEYAELIERCRAAIREGSAYQLCLTTRFTVPGSHDEIAAYLRLRTATPAHHGGFVRIGDRALLSASPEVFLRTADGRVSTRPIKGTRPRSADPAADAALAAELVASAKERAENVMIVDLMRNDLSRVCAPGSIRVDGLWEVEAYPAVHQLVSTVSGALSAGATVADLWEAAFPAGSMTGAPKLSAMGILHSLERDARGVYSGCFGHIGLDGSVDLAMVIRSILVGPDRAWVGAGGGITWRSVAAEEVAEVATKASAPLAALGAALPEAWLPE